MIITNPKVRRLGRGLARTGAVASACFLGIGVLGLGASPVRSASAADAGTASITTPNDGAPGAGQPLSAGGSATDFSLLLPTGAACPGDSTNDSYRVQSFMVPAAVDPGSLQFGLSGPRPAASGAFARPLYDTNGTPYVNAQTADKVAPGTTGAIINIPALDYAIFAPGAIPAGSYRIGIACTLGPAAADQVKSHWSTVVEFVTDPADSPAQARWSAQAPASTTTTTAGSGATTTTTAASGVTTTTAAGSATTTTTAATGGTTTTTVDAAGSGSTTTSTTVATPDGGAPSGSSFTGGSFAELPATGSNPASLLTWGALLIVFGRMAVLLGRSPEPAMADER